MLAVGCTTRCVTPVNGTRSARQVSSAPSPCVASMLMMSMSSRVTVPAAMFVVKRAQRAVSAGVEGGSSRRVMCEMFGADRPHSNRESAEPRSFGEICRWASEVWTNPSPRPRDERDPVVV